MEVLNLWGAMSKPSVFWLLLLQECGAQEVILYTEQGILEEVMRMTGGGCHEFNDTIFIVLRD